MVSAIADESSATGTKAKPGVDLPTRNLIRKKQEENPLLGEWRMYAALKQLGISVSPRTCGRIMAENRRLYAIKEPHQPKPQPFKATERQARRFETPYRSPQGLLWELDEKMWQLAKRLPDYAPRRRHKKIAALQLPLLFEK